MAHLHKERPDKSAYEAILAGRTVCAYAPQPFDSANIETPPEAAVRAATAMHEEPRAFAIAIHRVPTIHLTASPGLISTSIHPAFKKDFGV